MRQILYISTSVVPGDKADLVGILQQSRHNNAIDGITGLLWSDGAHFLQVFEGPRASVTAAWERICRDPRHSRISVLCDRRITARGFGDWTMAHRRIGEPIDIYDAKVRRLMHNATEPIPEAFLTMMAAGPVRDEP